jgi:hypothetical protein
MIGVLELAAVILGFCVVAFLVGVLINWWAEHHE